MSVRTAVRLARFSSFALSVSALVALLPIYAVAESTFERVKGTALITIGYSNQPPYSFMTKAGEPTGAGPEIAKHIFWKMGIKEVKGVLTEFDSLIPDLMAGHFDVIGVNVLVLPARCEQVAFSEPTYKVGQALLVKRGNPKNLATYNDIARVASVKLGVVAESVEAEYAEFSGVKLKQITALPNAMDGLTAVMAGWVDAMALTSVDVNYLVKQAGAAAAYVEHIKPFSKVGGVSVQWHGAFAFRKQDMDLVAEFNKKLEAFIGTDEHLKMVEPFGFTSDELPQKSTASLCEPPRDQDLPPPKGK